MNRLLACLGLFLVAGCVDTALLVDDVSYFVDKARRNMRVGILSETLLEPPRSDAQFLKALTYFAEREVDAVVLVGDVVGTNTLSARRGVRKVWEKAFPNDRRRDGSPVPLIMVTGERDDAQVYEELTGRPYASVFAQEVKGYAFIGANWQGGAMVDAYALKPLLAKVDRTKPFFYLQNLVPFATCCPDEGRAVYDGGKVTYMLSKFSNAVAICGRSHTPLTDEAAFWRGDFTCVNAGSFLSSQARVSGGELEVFANHGLVMTVYDSAVVFERLDFGAEPSRGSGAGTYVEKLGPDWEVSLPAKPMARPETPVPQFWDDTRLSVIPSEKVVSLRFPPVCARHTGVRAYAYRLTARTVGDDGTEPLSRIVWSPAFCRSEAHETQPVSPTFARADLPKGRVRFEVTPLDAFGKCGRPIAAETTL